MFSRRAPHLFTHSCLSLRPRNLYIPSAFVRSVRLAQKPLVGQGIHVAQNVPDELDSAFNDKRHDRGNLSRSEVRPTRHFIDYCIYLELFERNGISSILLDRHDLIDKIVSLELSVRTFVGAVGLDIIHKLSVLLSGLSEAKVTFKRTFQAFHKYTVDSSANVTGINLALTRHPLVSILGSPMRMEPSVCRFLWKPRDSEREGRKSTLVKLNIDHGNTPDARRNLYRITTSFNALDSTKEISLTEQQYRGVEDDQQIPVPLTNHRVYIALGSNIGDRVGMIEKACHAMDRVGIRILRTSCLYETEPMYVRNQHSFINGVCEVNTTLEPIQLLDQLKDIEDLLGREQTVDKGPRKIDLDILLFDDSIIEESRLTIPHKAMLEREFVLRPLCDLIPKAKLPLPIESKSFFDHLQSLATSSHLLSPMTPISPKFPHILSRSPTRKTRLMAILNMTPDSFSDGGLHSNDPTSLLPTLQRYLSAGMTILDVGGQSTRPRAPIVSPEEELSRVLPVIKFVRTKPAFDNVAISIDTFRAPVAKAAVEAGANIVNDVSAGQMDPDMLPTVARLGCTIILMHMRGTPETMINMTAYPEGVVACVANELTDRVRAAEEAGIRRWRIIIDPGIGFAKNSNQNLELLKRLGELRGYETLKGLPWLVGTSRKSFISKITGEKEPADRVWGTAGAVAASIQGGADIVRVHDVEEMSKVVKMADAIWRTEFTTPQRKAESDKIIPSKDQKIEGHKISVLKPELSTATTNDRNSWTRWSLDDPETTSPASTEFGIGSSGLKAQIPMTDLNDAEIAALKTSAPAESLRQLQSILKDDKPWRGWTSDGEVADTEEFTTNATDPRAVLSSAVDSQVEMPVTDLNAAEIAALPGSNPSENLLRFQTIKEHTKPEEESWKGRTLEEEDATIEIVQNSAADPIDVRADTDRTSEVPISDLDAAEISSLPGFRASESCNQASTEPQTPISKWKA